MSQAATSDPHSLGKYTETRSFCERAFDLVRQIEVFFGSVGGGEVARGFEAIKEQLSQQKALILGMCIF